MQTLDRLLTGGMYLGSLMMFCGIAGGAMDLLSGNAPVWFAGIGVGIIYVVLAVTGTISLWNLDEDRRERE